MTRWIPLTLTAALVAGVAALAPTVYARSIETPNYKVESEQQGFEVRRYEPRIVAEVTVEGEAYAATNAGFRILADFIFGNNAARTEVAMTAPVDRRPAEAIEMTAPVDRRAAQDDASEGPTWVIAFTMPSKYTLDTLPEPNDARVTIRELPATTYAVLRFSGSPSERVVAERIAKFVALVEDAGFTPSGAEPTYARYDPPWTLGFLRRNEIFVELVVE